jgi:hypothetical protein
VIVVIGSPRLRGSEPDADVAGLAASMAVAAAAEGARVELIGKIGDDPAGDAVLLALARRGVGHVAMLRDPARSTTVVPDEDEPMDPDAPGPAATGTSTTADAADRPILDGADAGLALRYLPEIAVIVAVHVRADVLSEAVAAAGWTATSLVVVVPPDQGAAEGLPVGSVSLAVADEDESAAGASIGRYAAAIDRGEPPRDAYAALVAFGSTSA